MNCAPDIPHNASVTEDILNLLTSNGLRPQVEVFDSYAVISIGNVSLIVIGRLFPTPEEATAQSEAIRSLLELRRGGAQVMVVTEDLWRRKQQMTASRILSHCGIYSRVFARNCEVRKIERPVANVFMDQWHSYGAASCRHCYGLFTARETASKACESSIIVPKGSLVAVAEFSNARRWHKDDREIRSYEWVRYASLPWLRVSGGMGKVLKKFIEDINPDDIMSYADLEWSDGIVYRQLGFTADGTRAPVLFTIDPITWERSPIDSRKNSASPEDTTKAAGAQAPAAYYRNFGSIKYRLNQRDAGLVTLFPH